MKIQMYKLCSRPVLGEMKVGNVDCDPIITITDS